MNKNLKKILAFLILIILSGCKKNVENFLNINHFQEKIILLKVSEVECQFCKDLIFEILSKFPETKNVEFKEKLFQKGQTKVKLTLKRNSKLERKKLAKILSKEGFKLTSFEEI